MRSGAINLGNHVSNSPLNRGLVGWWLALPQRMGGGRLLDLFNKNHLYNNSGGTSNFGTFSAGGRPGGFGCFSFVSASSQIAFGETGVNALTTSPLTLACWFRPNTFSGTQGLITNTQNSVSNNYALEFGRTANKVTYLNNSAAVHLTSTASITTSEWNHLTLVRTGSTGSWSLELYINGVSDKTASTAGNPDNGASSRPAIGGWRNTSDGVFAPYNGLLDDCRVWERGLSASEASGVYNDSRTGYQQTLNRLPMRAYGTAGGGGGNRSAAVWYETYRAGVRA